AQARRGRRRLSAPGRAGRGGPPHVRADVATDTHRVHALARVPRSVGSEVAVARSARAPGGEPRAEPPGRERGDHARLFPDYLEHHSAELRLFLAAAGVRLRSSEGATAPRGGGLSPRLRRRRSLVRTGDGDDERGADGLPPGGRNPREAAAA